MKQANEKVIDKAAVAEYNMEEKQVSELGRIEWWADRVLDFFLMDPRRRAAWRIWRAQCPANMGSALRFRVYGSRHDGYVTVRYLSYYNLFDVELGRADGTAYVKCAEIKRVHKDDLVPTISKHVI